MCSIKIQPDLGLEFKQLAVRIDARLHIERAIRSLDLKLDHSLFERAAALAARGLSLTYAPKRAKLIDSIDYSLLIAANKVAAVFSGLNHVSVRT